MDWAIEEKSCSQRRACGLIGLDPKTYRHASRRSDDAGLRARLKALASERRQAGYRRLQILLRREDIALNHKKLFRAADGASWRVAASALHDAPMALPEAEPAFEP